MKAIWVRFNGGPLDGLEGPTLNLRAPTRLRDANAALPDIVGYAMKRKDGLSTQVHIYETEEHERLSELICTYRAAFREAEKEEVPHEYSP